MANWNWATVETISGVDGHMAVQGNLLWVSADDELYYSSNGEDFTQDTDWTYGDIHDLVVLGSALYAIHNDFTDQNFDIYRRTGSGWSLMASTAASSTLYAKRAWGDDSQGIIVIGGYYGLVPAGLRIWRYDDWGGLVLEHSEASPAKAAEDVCYSPYLGQWFAAIMGTPYGGKSAIMRRQGDGTWVDDTEDYDAWDLQWYRRFGVHRKGVYIGHQDAAGSPTDFYPIRKTAPDGDWEDMPNPLPPLSGARSHTIFYGWNEGGHYLSDYALNRPEYLLLPAETWPSTGTLPTGRIIDHVAFKRWIYALVDAGSSQKVCRAELNTGTGIPVSPGDSKALVCDHETGDTLYVGIRDTNNLPMIFWVDRDFGDHWLGYHASSGSSVGVQTMEDGDECIGFGFFGTNKQIIVSTDKLETWDEAQGQFGSDEVTTMQYHPSDYNDLVATRRTDQDLIQTLTQRAPWDDLGATPFVVRSQLRIGDDIYLGSDVPDDQPIRMYSSGSWSDRSSGLPTSVAINDLEYAP